MDAIRPSPDRVRETLFNWLQPVIDTSRVLDLFAGSGVLGLEALSRGSRSCVFVDREPRIVAYLQETLKELKCTQAVVHKADALQYLRSPPAIEERFDGVFLDPPFRSQLLGPICDRLAATGWLAPNAWIYLECERELDPPLAAGWMLLKSGTAGQVGYHLARAASAVGATA